MLDEPLSSYRSRLSSSSAMGGGIIGGEDAKGGMMGQGGGGLFDYETSSATYTRAKC
jgi:hypothetical protein